MKSVCISYYRRGVYSYEFSGFATAVFQNEFFQLFGKQADIVRYNPQVITDEQRTGRMTGHNPQSELLTILEVVEE